MLLLLLLQYCVLLVNCSNNTTSSSFRVANGLRVSIENYQHLVRIFIVDEIVGNQPGASRLLITSCTGMKVTRQQLEGIASPAGQAMAEYVLTAGYCMSAYPPHIKQKLRQVFVAFGHRYLPTPAHLGNFTFQFPSALTGYVQPIQWISSDYNPVTPDAPMSNDIALIKLMTPLKTPVVELEFTDMDVSGHESCQLAGWGVDQWGKATGYLQKVKPKATELNNEEGCQSEKKRWINRLDITSAMKNHAIENMKFRLKSTICSVQRSGSVGCHWDWGAPLICKKGEGGKEKVYGTFTQTLGARNTIEQDPDGNPRIVKKGIDCAKQGSLGAKQLATYVKLSHADVRNYLKRCTDVLAKSDQQLQNDIQLQKYHVHGCRIHELKVVEPVFSLGRAVSGSIVVILLALPPWI